MRVHHLNCGTMESPAGTVVCHVLLLETESGLVLVDTGFGLLDCADPRRLGPVRHVMGPILDIEETAAHQVERLGFQRADVRHIITTHFDLDHIGGLADFPLATVHVSSAEMLGSARLPGRRERIRYRRRQWDHAPRIIEYEPRGDSWRGFSAVRELTGIGPGIALVFMPGHTRGHAAIAVEAGTHWVLHCGDAFYMQGSLDGVSPVPQVLRLAEQLIAFDRRQVRTNHERLSELWRTGDPGLLMVSAHDPALLARAQAGPPDRSSLSPRRAVSGSA